MDFLKDLGPFILAVAAVIINGVPQLLYAQARGFALKPAGFAYLVGGFGNLLTGSVTPISSQAETITVASVKKNLRDNVSSILLASVLMITIAAFGGISKISDFAGVAIISGMMSGVGLILAGVSLDMFNQDKRTSLVSIITAIAAYAVFYNSPNKVVWTIFFSVAISTVDFLLLQKRRVDISATVEEGREYMKMSSEWRFWKKDYWKDFKLI
ncbi:MAG TPA: xanthine/uracil permease, partial [Clostridiales bacterium]|nr:xanthine/uracil permease [Clostridiales bacterium]